MANDVKQNGDAVDSCSDSVVGGGEVSVGNSSLEVPKRPRSAAQIAAFEKTRARSAENLSKLAKNDKTIAKKFTPCAPTTAPPSKTEVVQTVRPLLFSLSSNTKTTKIRYKRKKCTFHLRYIIYIFLFKMKQHLYLESRCGYNFPD